MNCHRNNEDKKQTHNHNPLKHMLHMIICCGLPIVIVGILPLIAKYNSNLSNILARVTPFLCPIMMVSMLVMMLVRNKKTGCCSDTKHNDQNSKESELI